MGKSLQPDLTELTTQKNLQFLLRASFAQGICSSVSLYVPYLTFSNPFPLCKIIKKNIYIYIYIYIHQGYGRKRKEKWQQGKMAANLSFSPRHTLCPSSKHTRLGFHWVDGPQVWVFLFMNFAMSSLVECRIVPQPRIKPEPPP